MRAVLRPFMSVIYGRSEDQSCASWQTGRGEESYASRGTVTVEEKRREGGCKTCAVIWEGCD